MHVIISTEELEDIKTQVAALDNIVGDLDIDVNERIRSAVLATARCFALKMEGIFRWLFILEGMPVAIPPSGIASTLFHPSTPAPLMPVSMNMQIMCDDDMSMITLGKLANSLGTLKLEVKKRFMLSLRAASLLGNIPLLQRMLSMTWSCKSC